MGSSSVRCRQDAKIVARTSAPKTSASKNIISLKVTLRGVKPPVWRRLLVPGTMTLGDLHKAIQASLGWRDCHLHASDSGGKQFGDRRRVQPGRVRPGTRQHRACRQIQEKIAGAR